MSDTATFEEFPKIPRLKRGCVITEKIDGTNGQIHITEDGDFMIGSRGRYMKPEGLIVYHAAARSLFKVTLDKDDEPKGRFVGVAQADSAVSS